MTDSLPIAFWNRRRLRAAAAVLLASAVLSGCARSHKVPSAGTAPETANGQVSGSETAEDATTAEGAEKPVQETTVPKPDFPDLDDDPAQLIKMTRDDLNGLLGQPDLVRRENPAEIWQYRGKNCILDLFLYNDEDDASSPYRVVYSEARDRVAGKADQRACLNELLRAQLTS